MKREFPFTGTGNHRSRKAAAGEMNTERSIDAAKVGQFFRHNPNISDYTGGGCNISAVSADHKRAAQLLQIGHFGHDARTPEKLEQKNNGKRPAKQRQRHRQQ